MAVDDRFVCTDNNMTPNNSDNNHQSKQLNTAKCFQNCPGAISSDGDDDDDDDDDDVFEASDPSTNCEFYSSVVPLMNGCLLNTKPTRQQTFHVVNEDWEEKMPSRGSSSSSLNGCMASSPKNTHHGNSPRKHVHFADNDGKPLVEVFSPIDSSDESPDSSCDVLASPPSPLYEFAQPISDYYYKDSDWNVELLFPDPLNSYTDFAEKLRRQSVALESVGVRSGSIKGMIRVQDLTREKAVFVRATYDNWASYCDLAAAAFHMLTLPDGGYELFEYMIPVPPYLLPQTIITFAVCYRSGLNEAIDFWDNNGGCNYSIRFQPVVSSGHSSPISVENQTAVDLDEERAKRIRDFVWLTSWMDDNDGDDDDNDSGHEITQLDLSPKPA